MKKIVFNGFRHGHIDGLYRAVLKCPALEIAGCYEPDEAARSAASARLSADIRADGYDEMLAGTDIVAIGGRYGERGPAVIRALNAGKHVIADKPVCTSMGELFEIKRLCEEKHLSVICMLDLRYTPAAIAAKQVLDSGLLGEVRNVSFNGQHCIDYGKRPTWYFEPGMHGGTVNDLAIHGIDLVRLLTGMDFAQTDAVRTWNAYATMHPYFKDCATLMARLENGAGVLADVSYSAPAGVSTLPSYWEFRFWCERGMLSFHYTGNDVHVYLAGEKEVRVVPGVTSTQSWLTDLLDEIEQGDISITRSMLASAEQTLRLQVLADRA